MRITVSVNSDTDPFRAKAVVAAANIAHALQEIDARLRSLAKYEGKTSIDIVSMRSMLRDETEGFGDFLWDV